MDSSKKVHNLILKFYGEKMTTQQKKILRTMKNSFGEAVLMSYQSTISERGSAIKIEIAFRGCNESSNLILFLHEPSN